MVGAPGEIPVRVELVDENDNKVQFLLELVSTSFQTYFMNLNHPDIPPAFDMTKVEAVNLVFSNSGEFGIVNADDEMGTLKVRLNGFPFLTPDPDQEIEITPLPTVGPGSFASVDDKGTIPTDDDEATATVTIEILSSTSLKVNYEGQVPPEGKPESFGGAFFNYDDPKTALKESINLNQEFPDGMVFQVNFLDPGDGSLDPLSKIGFEIKDVNGNVWAVDLLDLQSFGKRYLIDPEHVFGIDTTQVQEIVFVIEGPGKHEVHLEWGEFPFIPPIPPDPLAGPITPMPLVTPGTFNSEDDMGTIPTDDDVATATVTIDITGDAFLTANYNGTEDESFGGVFFNFDDPDTGATETINIGENFEKLGSELKTGQEQARLI